MVGVTLSHGQFYYHFILFVSSSFLSGLCLVSATKKFDANDIDDNTNLCMSETKLYKNQEQNTIILNLNLKNQCVINQESKTFKVNRVNLTDDGYLVTRENVFYPPEDFCIEPDKKSARICQPKKTIWRKCCPENEIWDTATVLGKCQGSPIPFRPKIGSELQPFQAIKLQRNVTTPDSHPLICPEGYELKMLVPEKCKISDSQANSRYEGPCSRATSLNITNHCIFQLTREGVRYEASSGLFHRKTDWRLLGHEMYCVEGLFNNPLCHLINPDNQAIQEKCADSMEEILLYCDPSGRLVSSSEEQGPEKSYCLAAIWLSTCPLLVTAAMANLFIIQKNVHGWTLSCYLMSMFLVNINSVVLALEDQAFGCRIIDFTMKFLYLSTLCWLTAINFSLWRTFRFSLPKQVPQRFVGNCLFSLGFPFVVVTITYIIGKRYTCDNQYCALYSHETLPYFSGPVIVLILVNLGLFLKTTLQIATLRRETSTVLQKESKDNLESFRLFTKLFLMTGSIWVIRVVLLFLQLKGLYFTWYGVLLEAFFSIPEAAFSIMVLLHPEFVKWAWNKSPTVSRRVSQFIPCFANRPTISLEMGSKSNHSNTLNTTPNKSPCTSVR